MKTQETNAIVKDHGSSCSQGLREGMEDDISVMLDKKNQNMYIGVFDG